MAEVRVLQCSGQGLGRRSGELQMLLWQRPWTSGSSRTHQHEHMCVRKCRLWRHLQGHELHHYGATNKEIHMVKISTSFLTLPIVYSLHFKLIDADSEQSVLKPGQLVWNRGNMFQNSTNKDINMVKTSTSFLTYCVYSRIPLATVN